MVLKTTTLRCESAPKWDPFSSPGKHLISARKFALGGVRIGADRHPCWWRAFSVSSATYAEVSRGPTSVLIHSRGWKGAKVAIVLGRNTECALLSA